MQRSVANPFYSSRHVTRAAPGPRHGAWGALLGLLRREFVDLAQAIFRFQIVPAFFSKAGLVVLLIAFAFVFDVATGLAGNVGQELVGLTPAQFASGRSETGN